MWVWPPSPLCFGCCFGYAGGGSRPRTVVLAAARSEAPDCGVPVVCDSGGEQSDELPVDEHGAPTVRFGVGEITWTAQP